MSRATSCRSLVVVSTKFRESVFSNELLTSIELLKLKVLLFVCVFLINLESHQLIQYFHWLQWV